jgi:hypothetical protein
LLNIAIQPSCTKKAVLLPFFWRLKRLTGEWREEYGDKKAERFRCCGECEEVFAHPHHDSVLFSPDFPGKRLFFHRLDCTLYTSGNLPSLWPYGFCAIGSLAFNSVAYGDRYVMKGNCYLSINGTLPITGLTALLKGATYTTNKEISHACQ